MLESFNDDLAVSGLLSDEKMDDVLKRHEDTLKFMFLQTWTNSSWTPEEEEDAQSMLISELLPVNDLCLFISAVTLSLMECFDLRKSHVVARRLPPPGRQCQPTCTGRCDFHFPYL